MTVLGFGSLHLRALLPCLCVWLASTEPERNFIIKDDAFHKDGKEFHLRSGSLHYARVTAAYWRDRIRRMKSLGLNSVTTYVPWNFHEHQEGTHDFSKSRDILRFVQTIHEEGMLLILRPGPYICGEWDLGGLPAWLLAKEGIRLRTYDSQYIAAVDRWWDALLPPLRKYVYSRGGPIIMVQLENEFGSFGNCSENADDVKYMNHLLDLATSHLGSDVLYSTVDGGEGGTAASLGYGSPWQGDPRVFATVDGGLSDSATYEAAFQRQKNFNAPGNSPKMWTELWVGWFTAWGQPAANKSHAEIYKGMAAMMKEHSSFSLYMAHGGTNFGMSSGANGKKEKDAPDSFVPDITSYDYSSPISEAGDHNIGSDTGDLFHAIQKAISDRVGPLPDEPPPIPKAAYGKIELAYEASFFNNIDMLGRGSKEVAEGATFPSLEQLGHTSGLILYRRLAVGATDASSDAQIPATDLQFSFATLHDRVQVFVDGIEVGTAYRPLCPSSVHTPAGSSMDLLVENMGHINYGPDLFDLKGLLTPPPLPGNWIAVSVPLHDHLVNSLRFRRSSGLRGNTGRLLAGSSCAGGMGPVFRRGVLHIHGSPTDTFLDTFGFTKGYIWINGHLLGRYWETVGPQHTLYVPGPWLHQGGNDIVVLDLHGSNSSTILSVARPRWTPSTPAQDCSQEPQEHTEI